MFLLGLVWDITYMLSRQSWVIPLSNHYKLSHLIIYMLNVLRPVLEAAANIPESYAKFVFIDAVFS